MHEMNEMKKQAGAELCQAQAQVGLPAKAELILMLSSMEAIFHLFKKKVDSIYSPTIVTKQVLLIPSY
jgi:hypothetical protein